MTNIDHLINTIIEYSDRFKISLQDAIVCVFYFIMEVN